MSAVPAEDETVLVTRTGSIAESDSLMSVIASAHAQSRVVRLRVAHQLKNDDFGGLIGVVQLIVTWAAHDPERVLHSYIEPQVSDDDLRRTLRDQPHLLVAVVVARTVLSTRGIDLTRRLKALAREASSQAADDPDLPRAGHASFLAYEDSRTRWTSVAAPLYETVDIRRWMWDPHEPSRGWPFPSSQPPRVIRGSVFAAWLRRLSTELIRSPRVSIPDSTYASIAVALSEAFDNADQWGRAISPDRASLRLLRMEWASRTPAELAKLGAGDVVINNFARRASARSSLHAEFSVVDAGPGIFHRRLVQLGLDNESAGTQFDAIRTVLAEGVTDDPGGPGEQRGRGFTHIFDELTALRGALRIRTGKLALSRDFEERPFTLEERASPRMFDASSGAEVPTDHPDVVGTSITLIVPTVGSL